MNLREKIEVMEAADRGKIIEVQYGSGVWDTASTQPPKFNWAEMNYRVKRVNRIPSLAKENGIHDDDLRLLAALARAVRRDGNGIDEIDSMGFGTDFNLSVTKVTGKGDITIGCQTIVWKEIDEFAKQQGYWK